MPARFDRAMLALAAVPALLCVLLLLRPPALMWLWPFPATSGPTFVFLASILAAAAASSAWAATQGEAVSYGGIALDIMVIFWPMILYLLVLAPARGGGTTLLWVVIFALVLFGTWLAWRTVPAPVADPRRLPPIVLVLFVIAVVSLVVVGASLVARVPNVVPWALTPETSVVCGLIFLGAAAYFTFGLARRGWSNAGGQLAGFLAYDIVLLPPLAAGIASVPGYWRTSLWLYIAVLAIGGVVGAWFLFVDRRTRVVLRATRPEV